MKAFERHFSLRSWSSGWSGMLFAAGLVACAPVNTVAPPETAAEPEELEAPPAAEAAPGGAERLASEELANAPPAAKEGQEGSAPREAEPSPQEMVAKVCEANCVRMDSACAASAKICRASCEDYVAQAEKCPVEIYEALECQGRTEDFMLCSNVSPEGCARLILAMKDCRSGKVTPAVWGAEKELEAEQDSTPPGWARLTHEDQGFSIPFPSGATWKTVDGIEEAAVQVDGIDYRAKVVSLGGRKLSDGLILRTVVSEVGRACESKVRIFGRFEAQGTVHIRFNSSCKGDEDYHGGLYIRGDRAVIVSMHRTGAFDEPPAHLEDLVFGYRQP